MKKIILFIILPLLVKAQQCDSLLSYYKPLSNTPENRNVYLKDLETIYEEINQKTAVNSTGICPELLNLIVKAINQKQVEQEFAYCDFALKHAKRLLISRDSVTACEYYQQVLAFGVNFASSAELYTSRDDNRKRYFDYLIAGGIGMLNSYRYNKKRLESLNPYLFVNAELSEYYEEALKQVGLKPKY